MEKKKFIIEIEVDTEKQTLEVVGPKDIERVSFPVKVGEILKQGAIVYSFTRGNPICYFNLQLAPGIILRIPYPC